MARPMGKHEHSSIMPLRHAAWNMARPASPALRLLGFVCRGNGHPEASRVIAAHGTAANPNSSQTGLAAGFLPGVSTERLSRGGFGMGQSPLRSSPPPFSSSPEEPRPELRRNILSYRASAEVERRSAAERPCPFRGPSQFFARSHHHGWRNPVLTRVTRLTAW
jgi:hypothetical protein